MKSLYKKHTCMRWRTDIEKERERVRTLEELSIVEIQPKIVPFQKYIQWNETKENEIKFE